MSMVCCFNHRPQQSVQISCTTRAPMGPGKGGRSNPARVWPQREHVTWAGIASARFVDRQLVASLCGRPVVARVFDLREPDQLECADIDPADVELEPPRLELRALRVR